MQTDIFWVAPTLSLALGFYAAAHGTPAFRRMQAALAPVLATVPAFLAFSVIPLGPTVSLFGERTPLQLTDAPIGVLVVLACSAMGVYGIVLAGWASGSTYPLLGGLAWWHLRRAERAERP